MSDAGEGADQSEYSVRTDLWRVQPHHGKHWLTHYGAQRDDVRLFRRYWRGIEKFTRTFALRSVSKLLKTRRQNEKLLTSEELLS